MMNRNSQDLETQASEDSTLLIRQGLVMLISHLNMRTFSLIFRISSADVVVQDSRSHGVQKGLI